MLSGTRRGRCTVRTRYAYRALAYGTYRAPHKAYKTSINNINNKMSCVMAVQCVSAGWCSRCAGGRVQWPANLMLSAGVAQPLGTAHRHLAIVTAAQAAAAAVAAIASVGCLRALGCVLRAQKDRASSASSSAGVRGDATAPPAPLCSEKLRGHLAAPRRRRGPPRAISALPCVTRRRPGAARSAAKPWTATRR